MLQLLDAANYTKSHIMFYWWTPDDAMQRFTGTDFEFFPLSLPRPTNECTKNRVFEADRCSGNHSLMYGAEEGSCDAETHSLKRLTVQNLYENAVGDIIEPLQSPAYFFLRNMKITELDLEEMFTEWIGSDNDRFNYGYREAVW